MKESAFASKIMRLLRAEPRCRFATRVEGGMCAPGIPDIFLLWKSWAGVGYYTTEAVWLELKTDTGKLRKSQKIWHNDYRKARGRVGVLRPKDIKGADDLMDALDAIVIDADKFVDTPLQQ